MVGTRTTRFHSICHPGSNLTLGRLYVYVSKSRGIQTNQGVVPSLSVWLNDQELETDKVYIDTDEDGNRNVSATYAYDVLRNMKGNGTSLISLRNPDFDQIVFSVDNVMLLVAYEQEQGTSTQYWIGEGCDVILSDPKRGILPEDAATSIAFAGTANTTENCHADLIFITTGIDRSDITEHFVKFNHRTWYNALTICPCQMTSVFGDFIVKCLMKFGTDRKYHQENGCRLSRKPECQSGD